MLAAIRDGVQPKLRELVFGTEDPRELDWLVAKFGLEPRKPWADRQAWTPEMRLEHGRFRGGMKAADGKHPGRRRKYDETFDRELDAAIARVRGKHPSWGARGITVQLQNNGLDVKRWKVEQRLKTLS
jgi:hypothetical protein